MSDRELPGLFMRSAYNYDTFKASLDTALECKDPSKTVQSDFEDSDINVIVKRFGLTGELPDNFRVPVVGDFEEIFDFQAAQNAVAFATEEFMRMPADLRSRFNNDPAIFHDFAVNPDNIDDMVKFGLAIKKPVPDNTPAPEPGVPTE